MCNSFILKGSFCHTPDKRALKIHENAYAICINGISEGIYDAIPERFRGLRIIDCTDKLIVPGMVDLHIHASQYSFLGTGMDYELLEWLQKKAFPAEMRFEDEAYSRAAYTVFAGKMRKSATTRAVIFGTIHTKASLILMDLMEKTGIISYVGKVNMDRNAPPELTERDAGAETRRFLEESCSRGYKRTHPILTPRFIPSCSDDLLGELSRIRREYDLPVQSHLSENPEEVALVSKLVPEARFYGDAYDRYGLFGKESACVMAHCVYSTEEETERIRENGVFIAHCPASNMNLASGIAPVRKYLDMDMRIGLGSDVGGGHTESVFRAVTDAIQVSKIYRRYVDPDARPLTFPESFYMATKGGAAFFREAGETVQAGSFEKGFSFDAVVLDDSETAGMPCEERTVADRLERAFYLGLDRTGIVRKMVAGRELSLKDV